MTGFFIPTRPNLEPPLEIADEKLEKVNDIGFGVYSSSPFFPPNFIEIGGPHFDDLSRFLSQ